MAMLAGRYRDVLNIVRGRHAGREEEGGLSCISCHAEVCSIPNNKGHGSQQAKCMRACAVCWHTCHHTSEQGNERRRENGRQK